MKPDRLSPRSGLMKIAQRFIHGDAGSVAICRSPVSGVLVLILLLIPSTKVLGYFRNVRSADEQRIVAVVATQNDERKFGELKVLAEGFHSKITQPFVAVVRDVETYAALRKLDENLPKLDEGFFKESIVVAAFLGERNTGGYSVEITLEGKAGIRVREKAPGKGVMVPQMITYPFKMVAVEISGASPIVVALGDSWNGQTQPYSLKSGTFGMSGGIAGRVEQFGLEGKVSVIRVGRLATFSFLLKNTGETNEHLLIDCATGIVERDGAITIHKLSAMSLVNLPNSGLRAEGSFSHHDNTMILELYSLPSMIADGYGGGGRIEAMAIVSAPKP
jgi:hypothetical protein